MPIYLYKHPETGEIFEVWKSLANANKEYISEDGVKCEKIITCPSAIIDKKAEVWKKAGNYVRNCNPKWIQLQDGTKERYDPTKHYGYYTKDFNLPKKGKFNQRIMCKGKWYHWNDKDGIWEEE